MSQNNRTRDLSPLTSSSERYDVIFKKNFLALWVKALCYKPEGRGLILDKVILFFNLLSSSGRTRPWFTQPLNRNEYQKQKHNISGE
jgi:hypothetical protein